MRSMTTTARRFVSKSADKHDARSAGSAMAPSSSSFFAAFSRSAKLRLPSLLASSAGESWLRQRDAKANQRATESTEKLKECVDVLTSFCRQRERIEISAERFSLCDLCG